MIVTSIGTDYIELNEDSLYSKDLQQISRVHLIKLSFDDPTEKKVKKVLELFPKTNRFVIEKDIKIYNFILRGTSKKYYVSNVQGTNMISFFRKNNKILVNFNYFDLFDWKYYLIDRVFEDLLRNVEVIDISKDIFDDKINILEDWRGNVIVSSE
jgi:hypothetical protein